MTKSNLPFLRALRALPILALATLASATVTISSAAAAELTVVADYGGTSALPYYQDLEPEPTQPPPVTGIQTTGAFPVETPELRPGTVQGRVINAPGLQPMFLIGDDQLSQTWLSQKLQDLQRLQAVGLVVNVASADRLEVVRRWAPGLQVMPVPASDIAVRLGLQHYPVLITSTTLQQ